MNTAERRSLNAVARPPAIHSPCHSVVCCVVPGTTAMVGCLALVVRPWPRPAAPAPAQPATATATGDRTRRSRVSQCPGASLPRFLRPLVHCSVRALASVRTDLIKELKSSPLEGHDGGERRGRLSYYGGVVVVCSCQARATSQHRAQRTPSCTNSRCRPPRLHCEAALNQLLQSKVGVHMHRCLRCGSPPPLFVVFSAARGALRRTLCG